MRPFDPRLLRAVPAARVPVAALGLLGVCSGLLAIGQAFALAALVTAVVTPGHDLTTPALAVLGTMAGRGLSLALTEAVAARAGALVSTRLREALLTRWLHRRAEDRPDADTALVLATEGTTAVEPYVARFLPALVAATVLPVATVVTIAFLDWLSALIVVLTVPLLPFFAALIGWRTQEETDRRWRSLAALSSHFLDVMKGLPTLVSFGRATRQVKTIRDVGEGHRTSTMATLRIAFLSSAALELLATISVALVAVTVGLRLAHGGMPLLAALTCILLAPEAYWPIRRVGSEFHNAADGAQAVEAALAQLDADAEAPATHSPASRGAHVEPGPPGAPASTDAPHRTPGTTRAEAPGAGATLTGVTYRHPGASSDVLTDLTRALPASPGLTAVTGPSGAGKTTILELLAGQRTPTAGEVAAPRAHLVTQRPFLTAGTLRENLTLGGAPATDAELSALLDRVGLTALTDQDRDGLDARLGDDGFGVSAGQRARIALARAARSDARLLLLDEPTAHLDAESAAQVHDLVAELARERRVVVVTHREPLVALADDVWEVTR